MRYFTVAIDGPSGSGKSTVAEALKKKLGIAHLDTGAMYRALALALLRSGIDIHDEAAVSEALDHYKIDVDFSQDQQRTLVNGQDLTPHLYSSEVSMAASDISRYPFVREYLVSEQQDLAESRSFILDGRDIGTVVLPGADIKFFLTASPRVRAERRWKDLQAAGEKITLEEVLADIRSRDQQDSSRPISPLRQAGDAFYLDSSELNLEQVVETMLELIESKGLLS